MPNKILFMPVCSNIEIIAAPIEMSNEGFDNQNIAESIMAYLIACVPSGVPAVLLDMLDEYTNNRKYMGDGYDEYIVYIRRIINEKLV